MIINYICRYYILEFPYRSRPLAIKNDSNTGDPKRALCHRSTSISDLIIKNDQSVSTQTNTSETTESSTLHSTHLPQSYHGDVSKRKFSFHPTLFTSESFISRCFRPSSITLLRSSGSSTKSSVSWGQRSSTLSSSNHTQPNRASNTNSSDALRRIESERETLIAGDRRSHASTSSSSLLLHTNYHQRHASSPYHRKPLRRPPYQSRSAHVITNSRGTRLNHQTISSATNTNSSDSSSFMQRHHQKFYPNLTNHQRVRDDDLVAANERKALRVLMIIFSVFITLWTPFFICTLISAICDKCRERISPAAWFSITWLGYSSSMANPFIYTIFSDVFRRAFTNILLCRSRDRSMHGHHSGKFSNLKSVNPSQHFQRQISCRRSPYHDVSGPSTPTPNNQMTPVGTSDATIYMNRGISDYSR